MDLSISDVLGKKKIEKLLNNEVQYSTLVEFYQNIEKQKIDLISRHRASFFDLLLSACSQDTLFEHSKITQRDFRNAVYDALMQKLRIGLMAVDKIPLHEVSSKILRASPQFVSDDVVRRVCCGNAQYFTVKQQSNGEAVIHIVTSPAKDTRIVEEKTSGSKTPDATHVQSILKHFYRTRPDVIAALRSDCTYKDVLNAYSFWEKHASGNDAGFFDDWLLALSKANSPEAYLAYQKNFNSHLMKRIVEFVRPCPRSIPQITEHLCLDKQRFISREKVYIFVLSNREDLFIANGTRRLPIHQIMVKAKPKLLCPAKLSINDSLPEYLFCRIRPLLTTRNAWENVLSTYKILSNSCLVVDLIEKYGCFLNYLISLVKSEKKTIPPQDFKDHLQSLVKPLIVRALGIQSKNGGKSVVEIVRDSIPAGLLDDSFIRDVAQYYSHEFVSTQGGDKDDGAAEGNQSNQADEYNEPPEQENDPLADLESPRVLHLLTKQPRFIDIVDVFVTLPVASVSVLAKNSMSFFEWLISLSKRIMPHDASIFETHLQNIVQEEVIRLHSNQHCQMTIHHVHNLLCTDQPMLLSPNFLSWCLEQQNSSFCVYQSWIYLKNSMRKKSSEPSTRNVTSPEMKIEEFQPASLLALVSECARLSDLLHAIKAVPLEHVGYLLQSVTYWYDYLENNVRNRRDRQNLAALLAEDAESCLGSGIRRTSELVSVVSKGVANFVSSETLEYVLQQYRDTFAISDIGDENCRVGLVRRIRDDDLICMSDQEDALLRQVLLYFPIAGSCGVSTIIGLLAKEDSFLHKDCNSPDINYLKCFFLMFPMLFYLRDDIIVLTCMALDRRAKLKNAFYPTSTTELAADSRKSPERGKKPRQSPRKRSGSRGRYHSKSKRRRRVSSSSRWSPSASNEQDVITIEDSPENSRTSDDLADNLVVDEGDRGDDAIKNIINGLPASLVTDLARSTLLKNDCRAPAAPLLKELLFMTVGADESQQIESSEKLLALFKMKVFEVLRLDDAKFELVCLPSDQGEVTEVKLVQEEVPRPQRRSLDAGKQDYNDKGKEFPTEAQVEEISSTSTTPDRTEPITWSPSSPMSACSDKSSNAISPHSTGQCTDEDVIKFPASTGCTTSVDLREVNEEKGKSEEQKSSGGDSERLQPQYSTSSACSAYMNKEKSTIGSVKHNSKTSREGRFMHFFRNYLKINAGICATELLIASAYRRFQNDRFARSRLAFEAYVYDFVVSNPHNFALSGMGSEFGVSKILYRRGSPNSSPQPTQPANLSFLQLIPEVCNSVSAFLNTKPYKRSPLNDLCATTKSDFCNRLQNFPESEIKAVVRCLLLVSMMRNLKLFCFAVNEPAVYLRSHKEPEAAVPAAILLHKPEVDAILQNQSLKAAVILMAGIVKNSRPSSQSALRSLWQAQAPPELAKIFGTGISFTLALRKYSFLFPTSHDGTVTVEECAMEHVRRRT